MTTKECEHAGCVLEPKHIVGFAGPCPSAIAACDARKASLFAALGAQPCNPVILPVNHPYAEKTHDDFEKANAEYRSSLE